MKIRFRYVWIIIYYRRWWRRFSRIVLSFSLLLDISVSFCLDIFLIFPHFLSGSLFIFLARFSCYSSICLSNTHSIRSYPDRMKLIAISFTECRRNGNFAMHVRMCTQNNGKKTNNNVFGSNETAGKFISVLIDVCV